MPFLDILILLCLYLNSKGGLYFCIDVPTCHCSQIYNLFMQLCRTIHVIQISKWETNKLRYFMS